MSHREVRTTDRKKVKKCLLFNYEISSKTKTRVLNQFLKVSVLHIKAMIIFIRFLPGGLPDQTLDWLRDSPGQQKKRRRESEKGPINLQFLSPSFSPMSSIVCVLAAQLCFWSECQVLDRGISPEGESVYSDGWWDKNNWCDLVLAHSVVIFRASNSYYFLTTSHRYD